MTKIEWTEATWNPIVGCSIVSPGCTNCYAMKMAARLEAMAGDGLDDNGYAVRGTHPLDHYRGTTHRVNGNSVWTGKVGRAPLSGFRKPFDVKRSTTFFVCSMSDLFGENVPEEWIADVFTVMAQCPQHTFQVLTKRADRMRAILSDAEFIEGIRSNLKIIDNPDDPPWKWPLPNVWCGTSAERQKEADERIPDLLATPAAVRFVSAEPLLGPINFTSIARKTGEGLMRPLDGRFRTLDWIIVGGESGPGARPMHPDWARSIRAQCAATGVPFFFKQWGSWRQVTDADVYDTSKGRAGRPPAFIVAHDGTVHCFKNVGHAINRDHPPVTMIEVGKARTGRLLDGREWNEMPGASKYDQAPTDPHHGGKIWA